MESSPFAQVSYLWRQQQSDQQHQPMHFEDGYQSFRKISPDTSVGQSFSAVGTMPAQKSFQTLPGFDFENSPIGTHQASQQFYYEKQEPQLSYAPGQKNQYEPQHASSQLQQQMMSSYLQQSMFQSFQQPYHSLLYQQQQQFQAQKQTFQLQQSNSQQSNSQVQNHQFHQQVQQQNTKQHKLPKQQIQVKQILQRPSVTPKIDSSQPSQLPSTSTQQEVTPTTSNQQTSENGGKDNIVKAETKTSEDEGKTTGDDKCSQTEELKSNVTEKFCLANTKEKTPLCLLNELAHFNKLSHHYVLLDEQGPAHKKVFYVTLKLADEEYSASGESIKKAQHAAAAIALKETKYTHPPPKSSRVGVQPAGRSGPILELHDLCSKLGERAVYRLIEPQQSPYYRQSVMDYRGFYNMRYHQYTRDPYYPSGRTTWPTRHGYFHENHNICVSLCVGGREFIADGQTHKEARMKAAQKALKILRNLPVQNDVKKKEEQIENKIYDELKSEISLVHEIAQSLNMPVRFEVIEEGGPDHRKNFLTKCSVGNIVTEGQGNRKKRSKKKAAELMLEELRKLPNLPSLVFPKQNIKIQNNRKKNYKLIKSELQQQKADPSYGADINPISRLIQILQAQKKKEPVYTLLSEKGLPRREFVIQVEVENKTCTGAGPNKKLAKRKAAEGMLEILGCTKPSLQPTKSSLKHTTSSEGSHNGDKRVTFVDSDAKAADQTMKSPTTDVPPQRVPGLLHIPTGSIRSAVTHRGAFTHSQPPSQPEITGKLATILKHNLRPTVQLEELCQAFNYDLHISHSTKTHLEDTEHITEITIGGEQQSFRGSSNSDESSRDMAALDALKVLLTRIKSAHPCGDGPQVK